MTQFEDVRTDVDVDYMEHYQTGNIPKHLTILYEPKIIKVGQNRHMAHFRYDSVKKCFVWKIFNCPIIRNRSTVPSAFPKRHSVDMSRSTLNLEKPVFVGYENGEKIWTTTRCLMEDVVSFLKWYDIDANGRIYAAVPGRIPVMNFGRHGLPFPPKKGIFFS